MKNTVVPSGQTPQMCETSSKNTRPQQVSASATPLQCLSAFRAGLDAALKFDGTDYWGRQLQVYRAESRGGKGGRDGKGRAEKFEVFLKNY